MYRSLQYIAAELISRGVPQIILLVLAVKLQKSEFAVFTLLYGLESLLVILLPSNYVELLYKLKNEKNGKDIAHTIFSVNFVVVLLIILGTLLCHNWVFQFYNYSNIYVYIAIALSAFVNSYMRFCRTQYQLDFRHNDAIKNMLYSFSSANIGIILFLFLFDDKIMAFFVGKAIGFLLYFGFYGLKEEIRFFVSTHLLVEYIKRMKYLFLFAVYSWFFGYGFSYIVKIVGTPNDVANIGYVITFSMPFLLLANGINQVYVPKVKSLVEKDFKKAKLFSSKILALYATIFVGVVVLLWLIDDLGYSLIEKFNHLVAISAVVFLFSSLKYVYDIYLYVFDLFKKYVLGTVVAETITLAFIIVLYEATGVSLAYLYTLLVLSRSVYVYTLVKGIKINENIK